MRRIAYLIAIFVVLLPVAMGQAGQYSTSSSGGAPVPRAPDSPESLGIQAPEPTSSVQAVPAQEMGQPLLASDESSARQVSYGARSQAPGQISSRMVLPSGATVYNRLYVSSASQTVAGSYLYGYLPVWLQTYRSGPLWVYEWYPDGHMDVNYLGFTYSGWYKRWFFADAPGWHILQYYCDGWSNYAYVYVYGQQPGLGPSPGQVPPYSGTASVVLRSSWFRGYDVFLDGRYVGTEGSGGDALDGVYTFNVPGNMWHTIVISRGGQSYDETGTFLSGVTYRFTL